MNATKIALLGATLLAACSSSPTTTQVGTVPAVLSATSGGAQTGAVGGTVAPLVVTVTDAKGLPVPGVKITFVGSAGVTVADTAVPTDSAGRASSTFTLADVPGTDTVVATDAVDHLSVTFTATVIAGAPSLITIVSGAGQTGVRGTMLAQPLVVMVTDQFGNIAAGATVNWLTSAGTASAMSTVSDSTGKTSILYTLPAAAGVDTVTAAVYNANARVNFLVTGT